MKLIAGNPFFPTAGNKFDYPVLDKDLSTEIVIIGAGISGALMAWRLVDEGFDCTVIDCREAGMGSTAASTSLIQYELDIPLHELRIKKGQAKADRCYQLCGSAIEQLIGIMDSTNYSRYQKTKSILYSKHDNEEKFMRDEFNARKEAGFKVEFLKSEEITRQFGLIAKFGILSDCSATVNTFDLTHHLLADASKKGLKVFCNTKAVSIRDDKNIIVETEHGNLITARYAVNTMGYEVINFIPRGIVDFDCTYAIASTPIENLNTVCRNTIFWNTDHPYLYMRFTDDNRIIAGGRDEEFSNYDTMEKLRPEKSLLIKKDVEDAFPGLAIEIDFDWSGTFGKTKDSLPFIGPQAGDPNIFYSLGFGGNGITFSVMAAQMISDMMQNKPNPDLSLFSFRRAAVQTG